MRKAGADPKVKKTLIRNYEQKVRTQPKAVHDIDAGPSNLENPRNKKDLELDEPTLCSSETLASYLTDVKKSAVPVSIEDSNIDKAEISAKITKKLNFHFNDRIYKNLVELNTDVIKSTKTKDKRPVKSAVIKKDLEPCIEDFCQDVKENDVYPQLPQLKRKIKLKRSVENGSLHKLVASFEKI